MIFFIFPSQKTRTRHLDHLKECWFLQGLLLISYIYSAPDTGSIFSVLAIGSEGKESVCNVGGLGSIPGSGRSRGEGNGNPFRYSCLENPTDRGVWWATVHRVEKSQTGLRQFSSNRQHKELRGAPPKAQH